MPSEDLTVRVLIEIRDQVKETNKRIDETNARIGHLEQRVVASDTQLSAEVHAMHVTLRQVAQVMKGRRKLEGRVDRCEREIEKLKKKVG